MNSTDTHVVSTLSMDSDEELRRENQLQRERERASRKKRLDKTKTMRAQVEALEQTALAMRALPDSDAIWDEFLDNDTKRMRGSLRRLLPAGQQIQRLLDEKTQLNSLLLEHEMARKAVVSLLEAASESANWEAKTQRWKALARLHFRPLSISQCVNHIDAAMLVMQQFMSSTDRGTTGCSFMGWHDSRRLDAASSSLQFSLDKIYRGFDMDHHMNMMWRVYTEQAFVGFVMGGRPRVSVEVLQQLSPTVWVVRYASAFANLPVMIHELYLFFRVETEDGVVQYLTSIQDNALQSAMNEPGDLWTSSYFWGKWEVLDSSRPRSTTDYRMRVGGSLQGDDPAYLNRWLVEVLATAVRSESIAADRPMLRFS